MPHNVYVQERFLVEQQGLPGFFHVVARYGYNERVVQDANFVQVGHLVNLLAVAAAAAGPPPAELPAMDGDLLL
jgi:hypothetical protein